MGLFGTLLDKSIVFSFDRTGFARHAKRFDPNDLHTDLEGQRFVVSGASSGLGAAAVDALVRLNARVTMLCRNVPKGERVRAELAHPRRAEVASVDLSDFQSIDAYAQGVTEPITGLIHNAGVLLDARHTSPQGHELTVATNYLGPLRLTHQLWSRLTPNARIIQVSSGGMYSEALNVTELFDPPEPFDGVKAYAQTKRAQVVLSELLADRCDKACSSMHPGWADTPGVESSLPRFYKLTKPILRTPAQGADTIVWLAASPAAATPNGRFYFDREAQAPHLSAKTHTHATERQRLWAESCAHIDADPETDFV